MQEGFYGYLYIINAITGKECSLDIRSCTGVDFEKVLPLLGQLWPDATIDPVRMRAVFEACLATGQELLCAVEGDSVVGFLAMTVKESLWRQGRSAYVDALVVAESCRGGGIGAALLLRAAEAARSRGCSLVELDSFFHRERAHRFYEKQGYAKEGYIFGREVGEV